MRKSPEVKLLCQTYIAAVFKIIPKLTFIEIIPIYSSISNTQGCLFTHILPPNCVLSGLLIFTNLIGGKYFLGLGLLFGCILVFFHPSCFV